MGALFGKVFDKLRRKWSYEFKNTFIHCRNHRYKIYK
jgi:hypothetical protein